MNQKRRSGAGRAPISVRMYGLIVLMILFWISLTILIVSTKSGTTFFFTRTRTKPVRITHWARSILDSFDPDNIGPIDAVILWVNGTDPAQIRSYERTFGERINAQAMQRFRDYGTLRFTVRSVEKFAPWVRNIVLVTNGQIPDWWDVNNPRGRIVTHQEIFLKPEYRDNDTVEYVSPLDGALPTFNSNAIEANLHNIPGIAPYILYLNDDFLLGKSVPLSFFINTNNGRLRLHASGFVAPEVDAMRRNLWHRSVGHANDLINMHYNSGELVRHHYAGHFCYFFSKPVLDRIAQIWPEDLATTSMSKKRAGNDTSMPFMHVNVALEEGLGDLVFNENSGGYGAWTNDHRRNVATAGRVFGKPTYCLCLQDGFFGFSPNEEKEIQYLRQVLCEFLPAKSSFERSDQPDYCQ